MVFQKYSLSPDIKQWGFDLSPTAAEPDDDLHAPDAKISSRRVFSDRAMVNVGCLVLICIGLVTLL